MLTVHQLTDGTTLTPSILSTKKGKRSGAFNPHLILMKGFSPLMSNSLQRKKKSSKQKKFYVYTLGYPNGDIFYVGKGTGIRIDSHEREARRGKQSYKCNVIRKIWSEGGQVVKTIMFWTENEDEAYQYEIILIEALGGVEALTNLASGGKGGLSSVPRTPEWRAKIGAKSALRKLSQESIEKMRQTKIGKPAHENTIFASSKMWTGLISPDGELIPPFRNLNQFSREYGLRRDCLYDVLTGNVKSHQGWTCPSSGYQSKRPVFAFISPDGEVFTAITNLAQFCREHDLSKSAMSSVHLGDLPYHKGWLRATKDTTSSSHSWHLSEESKLRKSKTYDGFISPNGETVGPITNLTQFCKEHELHQGSMWRLYQDTTGKKSYKGWKAIPKQ